MHEAEVIQHESTILHVYEEIPTISSPILGDVGILTVATSTITVMFITFLIVILCIKASKSKLIPGKFQHVLEIFYEAVSKFITSTVGSEKQAKIIVPYVGSIMVYLLVANLLPMLPGVASLYVTIDGKHVTLLRGATTDFNTTFGMALAVVITMQIVGIKEQGVFGYLSHFIQIKQVIKGFRKSIGNGFEAVIGFFVGLIEIVSEIAKMLSLSLRLFGNLFAHEVLTVILLGAFSIGIPALWMGMGVLVGVVQSIVFVALVTVYYSMVLKKEH
ncbi:F0F1 ATP synthase subunit A [Candidatus Gracilibacteria bacterium]|nr:F0F1 ATP synthase subunit A [Candidatus Gracilibacteria bacterium]